MIRTLLSGVVLGIGVLALPLLAKAAIFSPSQAELLDMAFADFIDNPDPDNAALTNVQDMGVDGVKYSFDTDFDINDNLWRVAMEFQNTGATWPMDLSSFDDFRIDFLNPVPVAGGTLSAQIYVRSAAGAAFTSTSAVQLNSSFPVTLILPIESISNGGGDPSDVTSFGIELFGGDEFLGGMGQMANARTSPQPPTLADTVLYSWETPDDGGTAEDERFEGWTVGNVHPDHQQFISTTGATDGTHALQIDRTVTGDPFPVGSTNVTFRWGSSHILDANAGGGGPPIGDYNNDGDVDGADYTTWRDAQTAGAMALTNRDPDNMGPVDEDDFVSWRDNYGAAGGGPDAGVLAEIGDIVELINDPNSYSVSFDITIEDNFPDPNPPWANFFLAITADDGVPEDENDAWWQSAQVDVDLSGLSSGPVTQTIDFVLSQFDDQNENGVQSLKAIGIEPTTQYLGFQLASNTDAGAYPTTYSFYIDNFRIRTIVPEGAGSAAVPEPSSAIMAIMSLLVAGAMRRQTAR